MEGRAKKWWTEEIQQLLREARVARKGGVGEGARVNNFKRFMSWKDKVRKLKTTIRKGKKWSWVKFLEENGEKHLWDIVRIAKDP